MVACAAFNGQGERAAIVTHLRRSTGSFNRRLRAIECPGRLVQMPVDMAYGIRSLPGTQWTLRGQCFQHSLRCAMCGRLLVGKDNLHVAGLVGAAMCSAFECGSHDRWP